MTGVKIDKSELLSCWIEDGCDDHFFSVSDEQYYCCADGQNEIPPSDQPSKINGNAHVILAVLCC